MQNGWQVADMELLGECIDKGWTASQAKARCFPHRTRNALLGKAWNLGWQFGHPRSEEQRDNHHKPAHKREVTGGPGRTRRVRARQACVAFDDETWMDIERLAERGITFAQVVRELVEWGLEAEASARRTR